jgi:predicted CopG family antitoxin
MHDSCMATKTITLELDAYEKLRAAKRGRESFSSVVRRAVIPGKSQSGA